MTKPKQEEAPEDQQQPGESDKDFFARWKRHVKEGGGSEKRMKAVWLTDGIGRKVEISCMRSPKVIGTVRRVDKRFGKVMVECESEDVELTMSDIAQVRYQR